MGSKVLYKDRLGSLNPNGQDMHILFIGFGQKDIEIGVHMWPQIKGHVEVISGHWFKLFKICRNGHTIHLFLWIFMGF